MRYLSIAIAFLLAGCATAPPPRVVYVAAPAVVRYIPPPPQMVVSVYEDPPIAQPSPVAVRWAPPPMLVESPPDTPYPGAVWIGGYWVWNGTWVWAHGRWAHAPRPSYYWVHPYYENRNGAVIFITGYWSPPSAVFIAPPVGVHIEFAFVAAGVVPGPQPIGPVGVFVPAPPGSRLGIIVPAPIGTPPAVVTGAPPVVNVGMRIQNNVNSNNTTINNNVTNNVTNNITNTRNVTYVTNVTIIAPASATATGQAISAIMPAQAHVAAAMKPVVNAPAPRPTSNQAIQAFVPGRAPAVLPPPQTVHVVAPIALLARPLPAEAPAASHTPASTALNGTPPTPPASPTFSPTGTPPKVATPARPLPTEHRASSGQQEFGQNHSEAHRQDALPVAPNKQSVPDQTKEATTMTQVQPARPGKKMAQAKNDSQEKKKDAHKIKKKPASEGEKREHR